MEGDDCQGCDNVTLGMVSGGYPLKNLHGCPNQTNGPRDQMRQQKTDVKEWWTKALFKSSDQVLMLSHLSVTHMSSKVVIFPATSLASPNMLMLKERLKLQIQYVMQSCT